jgi:hypothetical protein
MEQTQTDFPKRVLRAAPYAAVARFVEKTQASRLLKGTGHEF